MQIKGAGFFLLLFLWGASFVYRQFQGGFVSNFLFYAMTLLSLLEIWIFLGARGEVKVERRINKKELKDGEPLLVDLAVEVKGLFPFLFVTVVDPLPPRLSGATKENRTWKLLILTRKIHLSYRLSSVPRGEHQFTEVWVESSDLFGFFSQRRVIRRFDEILVFPSYEEIRAFPTVNEKNTGLTFALGRTSENVASVMGIREYMSGDRLNRIHWKATARTGGLKTKEFEIHVTNDFLLFLDATKKGYGNRPVDFEKAVRLAATLVHFSVRNHFGVGLSLYQKEPLLLPLGRNPFHEVRIFKALAKVEPICLYPFSKHLVNSIPQIPYGTTALLITPTWDEEMMKSLSLYRMRKIAVQFFFVGSHLPEAAYSFLMKEGIRFHLVDNRPFAEVLKGGSSVGQKTIPDQSFA